MSLVSRWSGYRFFLFMLLLGGIGLTVTHFAASHYQQNKWASILKNYADRANQQLSSELAKFEQIPNLLSHDPRLLTYLTQPESNGLNQLLAEWSKQTLADTIYLHNQQGVVIGSSNYQQDDTFVGEDFSFRPYFIEAMQGHIARYVALGIRSNKRGYFYSAPIWLENKIAGVITVKVSLEELENSLAPERADIMVLDQNNVVFLSNQATWRYTALAPIAPERIEAMVQNQQYGSQAPKAHPSVQLGDPANPQAQQRMMPQHQLYLSATNDNGFRVITLAAHQQRLITVLQADVIFVLIFSLLSLIAFAWQQTLNNKRQLALLNKQLESKVKQRTEVLSESNQRLQQTIIQYEKTQQELKQTQQELTQAAKLALLGELSASINHEINQPLAALRTYTENSLKLMSMEKHQLVEHNLQQMLQLNETISEVIARLKIFTRKSTPDERHYYANLHDSVHNATRILSNKLIKSGVTLKVATIPASLAANIHHIELEQVLINLIHNAIQALEGQADGQIMIECTIEQDACQLIVSDNGPGIEATKLAHLFDPFFTTKPEGLGLGLTISKRIIESYQGSLEAELHSPHGMRFTLSLPRFLSSDASTQEFV
ncbi:sensor histidine kinase [Vibrio vulnificus]|uniref:sensor histidine kinase n=1 Tax=Vibrio vulnificus TaxID=672 RepID=UPI000CD04DF5|nr:ATP-binding protein [Vibrio vulnificus]EHU4976048.1 sensor histidine kinase [Vibrio vulnificus]MCU8445907.1 ATP-binding protein [Vibrio vulnificus]POC12097.1 histidine kinase [Vibrio vulnificus]POC39487.1 histidine kinase [Vibrio vulnificus]POC56963.1 histidine kinase [Vibrio vulnificus]